MHYNDLMSRCHDLNDTKIAKLFMLYKKYIIIYPKYQHMIAYDGISA